MDMSMFDARDLEQIEARGMSPEEAASQIRLLRNPPPPAPLIRPCTVGDGIATLSSGERGEVSHEGRDAIGRGSVLKFVPASGAASRMFKDLLGALEDENTDPAATPAREFFERLEEFAFAGELRRAAADAATAGSPAARRSLLRTLLDDLGYAAKPKALIPFHRSNGRARTAFEEHLLEASRYVRAADGRCRIHFTVAAEAREEFESELARVAPEIERARACRFETTFSVQHPSTDTLAVDLSGEPFRTDGALLFRPGGHGALLRNLSDVDAEIVSIRNIDNILPDERTAEVVEWKETLIGLAARANREVSAALAACSPGDDPAIDRAIALAARFARTPTGELSSRDEKIAFVTAALDRPIRVCGVVRNEGEPGGAPFWVRGRDGSESVQIVESSQVDHGDPQQERIWRASTHFNPVDIIAVLRNRRGEAFDLKRFVDPDAVFVSTKSHEGRELRALELPGLWNGAMAGWNTICVEVPASTFAPVKTVFDLLRPQHVT
jgi:hypothetical protein